MSTPNTPKALVTDLKSEVLIREIEALASEEMIKKIKAIYRLEITGKDKKKYNWILDLKNGTGSITLLKDGEAGTKADCTLILSDDDFVGLITGKLNAQRAFMAGSVKIKGNLMMAQRLQILQQYQKNAQKKSKL